MPLLSLPPEIIILIFQHVTPKYLNSHPEIQYISKKWHTYAQPIALKSLYLYPEHLRHFELYPHIHLLQSHTASITFTFPHSTSIGNNHWGHMSIIKSKLPRLSDTLAAFKKLQRFSLAPSHYIPSTEFTSTLFIRIQNILTFSLVESLPTTLTSLELDTIGKILKQAKQRGTRQQGNHVNEIAHVCPILKQFTILRVLRIRMRAICTEVFNVAKDSKVEEIVVDVGRQDKVSLLYYECMRCCQPFLEPGTVQKALVDAGKEAVKQWGLRRCIVLSQDELGNLCEVNCGTGDAKIYPHGEWRELDMED